MNFIKTNFLSIIILILVSILFLQRCDNKISTEKPTVIKDTVWVNKENTTITKPVLIKTILGKKEIQYVPDTSYIKLVKQYEKLVKEFTASNIQTDKIKIDSIGYISITDTISKNLIIGRKTSYNFKYPIITTTIKLPPERKNQLYYGGGLQGGNGQLINQFNAGLLLKTKSDQIYGIYSGMDTNGKIQFGLQSYWKISFNKK